jgi:hypothetical protein
MNYKEAMSGLQHSSNLTDDELDRCAMALGTHVIELENALGDVEARVEKLEALIRDIDYTLRVPAAEYVPAIRDVFKLIDEWKKGGEG